MATTSQPDSQRLAELLTPERLKSYADAMSSLEAALTLYDWNVDACASVQGTVAMVEVVVRNAMDRQLAAWAAARGYTSWLAGIPLDEAGRKDLAEAVRRASRRMDNPTRGKVVAELSFGFWRYLATSRYLTSLWIPCLQHAFPYGPEDPLSRRKSVDKALEQLVFVRNRAAHHEPIHRRDLAQDLQRAVLIVGMVDPVAADWVSTRTTLPSVLGTKPHP